jgi:N-dimethylarginine dimethylaminohydrolase
MQTLYFMSQPGPTWALRGRANFRSREAAPADAAGARREWLSLARAIEARGGTVVALPSPDAALTGLPYAAECGHALARPGQAPLFLLPRMKGAHRQPEREHWAPLARRMGFEVVDPGAGIWEAQGDVAELDGCTLLFWGGRTDREGHEAARRHFPGEVLELQIREPAFHGNMALLPLPAVDRLLVCPDVIVPADLQALERRFGRERLLPVSEEEIRHYATNGLPVGRDWLAPSVVPERVRTQVAGTGMNVVPMPMVNLCEKGGGASRCLVLVARVDGVTVPPENRLDAVARELEA